MSQQTFNPLELLKNSEKSDESRRSISTAALLWAVTSVVVVILNRFGWIASYENALPIVVLVSWLGAEIAARLPTRTPIAVCEVCRRVQILPLLPFRKLWLWKRCVNCGGNLKYTCPNNHLLSIFPHEEIKNNESGSLCCSRCGQPPSKITFPIYIYYLNLIARLNPKTDKIPKGEPKFYDSSDEGELGKTIKRIARGTELESIIEEKMNSYLNERERAARIGPMNVLVRPDVEKDEW